MQVRGRSRAQIGGVCLMVILSERKNTFLFPHQKFVIQTSAKAIQEVQNISGMVSWILSAFKLSHWT